MFLIVGLGNFGKEYQSTRHNFGFILLDQIIANYNFNSQGKKRRSEVFFGEIDRKKIIAIKPQTYMNLSGIAVAEITNFYKIDKKNILVLHDDVDLAFGKIKFKIGGGNGGHNGLKSIDENIGSDYSRLRLGVGKSQHQNVSTADYVLSKFSEEEMNLIEEINKKISQNFNELISGKTEIFLNKFYLKN